MLEKDTQITPDNAKTDPAARSRSPHMISNIAPNDIIIITDCCFITFNKLLIFKKFSFATPQTAIKASKINTKLYLFKIDLQFFVDIDFSSITSFNLKLPFPK